MFNSRDTGRNCCRMTAAVTVVVVTNRRDDRMCKHHVRGLTKPQVVSYVFLLERCHVSTCHVGLCVHASFNVELSSDDMTWL